MEKLIVLGIVWLLLIAVPAVATAEEPKLIVNAALSAVAVQRPDNQGRVRSMGRTWAGVAMLGGGAFLTLHAATASCATNAFASAVFDTQTCGQAWTKFGAGLGVATVGVLLATVFSDVPVMNAITIAPTQGGVLAGTSFGF